MTIGNGLFTGRCCALGFSTSVSDGRFDIEARPDNLRSNGERQWSRHDLVHPHHPLAAAGRGGHCRAVLQQELPAPRCKTFWDLDGEQVGKRISAGDARTYIKVHWMVHVVSNLDKYFHDVTLYLI